jgi:hypothetical protein
MASGSEDQPGNEEEPFTEAEVTAFARKLDEWGSQLPPEEQALLHVILGRAEGTSEDDVQAFALDMSIGDAASGYLSGLMASGDLTARKSWVKLGTPWTKWAMRMAL